MVNVNFSIKIFFFSLWTLETCNKIYAIYSLDSNHLSNRSAKLYYRPYPSSKNSYIQNEAISTKTFVAKNDIYLHENKKEIHINYFALSVALTQWLRATRTWSIAL